MRAAVVTSPDTLPVASDFPDPEPRPGEDLKALVGAGIHPVVRSLVSGRHYGSQDAYPLVPGVDAVARTADGTLVYTGHARSPWGTMATAMATPFGLPLPANADPLAIAAGINPAMSGFMPLVTHLENRETLGTVLVLGATGMAGRAAVQSALALGADVVLAAGRDADALAHLGTLGAEPISIADSPTDLEQAITQHSPALVLDYVWGPVAQAAFAALGGHGLQDDTEQISYVQIGSLAGAEASLPASLLRSRRITLTGSGAGSMSTQSLMARLPQLMQMIADGALEIPYTAYPLERVEEAWEHAGRSRAVVVPD
jgi:NADPH:quinone reductase-like Zn-dependent oxidoreductase